jgi:predicted metal-dependent hydrolase
LDRIRNARHFAPRLQRWLDDIASVVRPAPATAPDGASQLDLFGQTGAAAPAAALPAQTSPAHPAPAQLLREPDSGFPASPRATTPTAAPFPQTPPPVLRKPTAAPPPAPDAAPKRQLLVGQFVLEYTLRRSTRRSIGFMIDDDGLRVTAPKRISIAEVDNAIRTKQAWILSKLHERRERRAARLEKPPVEWVDGATLPYLGGEIVLRLLVGGRNRSSYNPATRELSMVLVPGATELLLKERVRAWLQLEARQLFEQRLDLYAARLGVRYHSFALSSAGTRWGSCTVDRKIRLNWRLVHFSLPLIDYVVAHELSHLLEMNHSARFWDTVGTIYPEYEEAKQLLRKRAQELPVLFG